MSAEGQNLQAKYQKLASEYAKLRAQNTVLKKAVIEEQEKTKSLQESMKQKDQTTRKYEQELDSLQFRNDQLSKRVAVLQDELDESSGKNWKAWASSPPQRQSTNDDVKEEELHIKIQENERLQRQIMEMTQQHRQEVSTLQERTEIAERSSSSHQKMIDEASDTHRMVIDKLQEDRAMMEVKLRKTEDDLRAASLKAEKSQQQLKLAQKELTSKYDHVYKILEEKVPFNDTESKGLNIYNVPAHDRKHQSKSKELTALASDLIKELTSGLSNYHTYIEQRIKIFYVESEQQQLSATTQKFCSYLHENAAVLRNVEQTFSAFHKGLKTDSLITLETVSGLSEFAEAFHAYVNYLKKLLPYHKLSMEEENNSSTCSTTLQGHNRKVYSSLVSLVRVFDKIDAYIAPLASASSDSRGLLPSNYNVCFMQLTCFLEELHDGVKEISKHYHSKISIEHQLPTSTQTLKTTDECLISTFAYLITVTGKIVKFFNNNLDFLSSKAIFRTRGATTATEADLSTSPVVISFRHQAVDYVRMLNKPCPDSVPYSLALHNHNVLSHSTDSRDTLSEQITHNQERMSKLEQAKEHWMLEAQLLQVKYEKELKKVEILEKDIHRLQLSPSQADASTTSVLAPVKLSEHSPSPTDLGGLETDSTEQVSDEQVREQLIKNHFTTRTTDLTAQLQLVDSKAVSFATECRSLYKRIRQAENNKADLAKELQVAKSRVKQVQEELEVTKRNYETQLSMMSEHLCGMNEKLTTQQDEIESLKAGRAKKGKK